MISGKREKLVLNLVKIQFDKRMKDRRKYFQLVNTDTSHGKNRLFISHFLISWLIFLCFVRKNYRFSFWFLLLILIILHGKKVCISYSSFCFFPLGEPGWSRCPGFLKDLIHAYPWDSASPPMCFSQMCQFVQISIGSILKNSAFCKNAAVLQFWKIVYSAKSYHHFHSTQLYSQNICKILIILMLLLLIIPPKILAPKGISFLINKHSKTRSLVKQCCSMDRSVRKVLNLWKSRDMNQAHKIQGIRIINTCKIGFVV